jgi:hypothetical protein
LARELQPAYVAQTAWVAALRRPAQTWFDGIALLHPQTRDLVVDILFSERGSEGEVGKGTSELKQDLFESIDLKEVKR